MENHFEEFFKQFFIGTHIKKDKTFEKSLKNFFENENSFKFPCQIFTGSTKMWKRPAINEKDIEKTNTYIKENDISLFIHSIYLINFGRPTDECENALKCLKYDLELGFKLKAKGVVVHCGKFLKMKKEEAIENMYKNIISLKENLKIPLIIETSSGQGTELLTTFDEFSNFYDKFTQEEKQKIKICIDTCHVFAAGHCPYEFITNWDKKHPESLILVHYNDSKGPKGCCKDRHEIPGEGHIGKEIMENIADYCYKNKIPMVVE